MSEVVNAQPTEVRSPFHITDIQIDIEVVSSVPQYIYTFTVFSFGSSYYGLLFWNRTCPNTMKGDCSRIEVTGKMIAGVPST